MTKTIVEALSVPTGSAPPDRPVVDRLSHQATDLITNPHLSSPHKTSLHLSKHPAGERSSGSVDSRVLTPSPQPQSRNMQVSGLNHFNITASPPLIERVKRFYIDIIGLSIGPRAHLEHEGYWLYAGEVPILHLSACETMETKAAPGRGYFNHISMSCVGLKAAIAKMIATQTPYRLIQLPDIHQTQIFLEDPAGIGVELTFFDEC